MIHSFLRTPAVFLLLIPIGAIEKPRVFITESQSAHLIGEGSAGDAAGTLSFSGGVSPANVDVMRAFLRLCPTVIITANREKADYVIRLDHEEVGPTTPFVRGNKVAVFDKNEDLIYTNTTRLLGNAVKDACSALAARGGSGPSRP